jgi:Protein of unknown function (DUF742)
VTADGRYGWREGDRVVPVYAFTRGRTRSGGQELPLEALVTTTDLAAQHELALQVEWRAIVRLCTRPKSLVEIGAALRVPVGVARVLVSDLANAGYLVVHLPLPAHSDGGPGHEILGRLLDGLRSR